MTDSAVREVIASGAAGTLSSTQPAFRTCPADQVAGDRRSFGTPGSGVWCVQLQAGGGSRRGAAASDDNAADVRARPRVCGMIGRTGPSRPKIIKPSCNWWP